MSEKIKQDISIGKNLHRLRKQAGLSQEQVAVKLQVMGLPLSAGKSSPRWNWAATVSGSAS